MPSRPHSAHDRIDARGDVEEIRGRPSRPGCCRTRARCRTAPPRTSGSNRPAPAAWRWVDSGTVRFGNTRCVLMVALPVARSGATQLVLLGRASSPVGLAGAGAGAAGGAGCGGACGPPPPPEHPAINITMATANPGRIGWLTWSWYSEFILSAEPFLLSTEWRRADRLNAGPFPHSLSPDDYTRGDVPSARRHCTHCPNHRHSCCNAGVPVGRARH